MTIRHKKYSDSASGRTGSGWTCVELPVTDYAEALELQHRIVAAKNSGSVGTNVLLILEHPPTFTLGRRGGSENLTVSDTFLKESGIRMLRAERGGNITFHGPGQLVAYPIINLQTAHLSVLDYVHLLEEVMIQTASEVGVEAGRNALNRGVWVGSAKLGSIGIAVRHGISFHGFALNVNLSLAPFKWINPCGLQGVEMTSLAHELSCDVPMIKVRRSIKHTMESVFDMELTGSGLEALPFAAAAADSCSLV